MIVSSAQAFAQQLDQIGRRDLPIGSGARGIDVSGYYAYIPCGYSGLQIFNIMYPNGPTYAGGYDTPGYANDVAVKDSLAFVADDEEGLQVINVANPSAPESLGHFSVSWAQCIDVQGNYAYLSNALGSHKIVDISDPANPILAATCYAYGLASDIQAVDSMLFILTNASSPSIMGLYIFNIADPYSPFELGHETEYTLNIGRALHVLGDYAYIVTSGVSLKIDDVSDPVHPENVFSYSTPGHRWDIYGQDNRVYLATDEPSLQVIDIYNPLDPQFVGSAFTAGTAYGIQVVGQYFYVAADSALQIFKFRTGECDYVPGDVNGSGIFNGLDVTYAILWLRGRPYAPPDVCDCPPHGIIYAAADANGSCAFNGMDITFMINHLMFGGIRFCPDCPPVDWP